MINVNDVKKDLYKSKVNAIFNRYVAGNLYYRIVVMGETYEFPISTLEIAGKNGMDAPMQYYLSSDLGTTDFYSEIKGSDLNRWIQKAIEKNEFIKL
jgi:hypothetical protein